MPIAAWSDIDAIDESATAEPEPQRASFADIESIAPPAPPSRLATFADIASIVPPTAAAPFSPLEAETIAASPASAGRTTPDRAFDLPRAQPTVEPPSLMDAVRKSAPGRFVAGAAVPVTSIVRGGMALGKTAADQIRTGGVAAVPGAVSGIVTGAARDIVEPAVSAIVPPIMQRKPGAAALGTVDQVIPLQDIAHRVQGGDYAGAAGEVLSTAALIAGPHAAERLRRGPIEEISRAKEPPVVERETPPAAIAAPADVARPGAPVPEAAAAPQIARVEDIVSIEPPAAEAPPDVVPAEGVTPAPPVLDPEAQAVRDQTAPPPRIAHVDDVVAVEPPPAEAPAAPPQTAHVDDIVSVEPPQTSAADEPRPVEVRRFTNLDADRTAVQDRAATAVENDTDALATAYRETFGNVIGADNVKELFPDYATKEQRTANDVAVHRPASRLAQRLYDDALKQPVAEGHDPYVVLTAGGTGSGKTSSLAIPELKPVVDRAHVVYDSTLTDLEAARTNIEAAKKAGHEVLVVFTDREVREAFRSTLDRAVEQGRPVTLNTHVATHLKAPEVFDALRKEYGADPDVTLAVVRNSTKGRELVPTAAWEPRRYTEGDVRAHLARILAEERARLGDPLADAVHGAAEEPAVAAGHEGPADGAGRVQPDAASGRPTEDARGTREVGGTTLEATVLPGARQFAEQDVIPAVEGAAAMGRDIKNTLSPAAASLDAQGAADTVRRAKATIANAAAIESSKYGQSDGRLASALRGAFGVGTRRFATVTKHFSKFSDADNVANISAYERTGEFAHAPAGYSEFYKKSMTDSRELLQQAYGEDRVGLVENYVRRAFVFGSKADEAKGVSYLTSPRSSLSANKSPTKGRVLDMPLDEALATMKARGISVKLAVSNPELLRQWSVSNARQAVAYADAWRQLKEADRITFVKPGDRVPEGAIPLDDRAARVFFPTDKGLVQAGSYYADPAVARVLNNTISQGLGASPTFRGIRTMNNALNQLQLGVSGFHFTGVAINTGVSDLALGLREIARGATTADARVLGRGVARAAGSVVPFQSFARDLYHGRALVEGLKNGAPEAAAFLEQKLNPAGGRLRIDARYRNQAYENMVRAFRNDNYIGAALRLPAALIEQTAKPLMEYAIPRVKLGAFMDLAHDITGRMPDATPADLHRAYAKAWDSIDNRFGQLVYDNLFWNKTAQDLAQVATRSVGWNLGTVREIGGGLVDAATQTTRGRGVSDRALYTAALPIYVGMIGAAYQYLKTGEEPSELKDYFYPRNGRTEPNGMASRTTLPTYMKDVYAYGSHPIDTAAHKQSPLLELTGELVKNEDFFGTMIRNPEDPAMRQLQDVGAHVLRSAQPFSLQQFQRTTEEGGGGAAHAESFFGFTKASASVERSPAETLLHDYLGPATRRTPEQRDRGAAKADVREAVKAGDVEKARTIAQQGQLTRRQLQDAARSARLTGLQSGFQRLGLEQALNVYEVASPSERGLLAPLLDVKVQRADENTVAPADVDRIKAKIVKAVALPRDKPSQPRSVPQPARLGMPSGRPQTRNDRVPPPIGEPR